MTVTVNADACANLRISSRGVTGQSGWRWEELKHKSSLYEYFGVSQAISLLTTIHNCSQANPIYLLAKHHDDIIRAPHNKLYYTLLVRHSHKIGLIVG